MTLTEFVGLLRKCFYCRGRENVVPASGTSRIIDVPQIESTC